MFKTLEEAKQHLRDVVGITDEKELEEMAPKFVEGYVKPNDDAGGGDAGTKSKITVKQTESLQQDMRALTDAIKALPNGIRNASPDEMAKFTEILEKLSKKSVDQYIREHGSDWKRAAGYDEGDARRFMEANKGNVFAIRKAFHNMMVMPAANEQVKACQAAWDDLYMIGIACRWLQTENVGGNDVIAIKNENALLNSKSWFLYEQQAREVLRAMHTQDDDLGGAIVVPEQMSRDLIDIFHLDMQVPALFQRVPMPTPTFPFPLLTQEFVVYRGVESTSDSGTKHKASDMKFSKVTFDAELLVGRTRWSENFNEDAAIAVLPTFRKKFSQAYNVAWEDLIINGDTAATHQDSDVTDTKDVRTIGLGLRAGAIDNGTVSKSASNANITSSLMNSTRALMKKYGTKPSMLAWIVGAVDAVLLLEDDDVKTMDKYGPNATIVKGEVARVSNIPIVPSEKMRDDLNASGVYDGTTTDRGAAIITHRDALGIGEYSGLTLRTDEDIETGQLIIVTRQRGDIQFFYPVATEKILALLYNIKQS